jgi:hypothetical protein
MAITPSITFRSTVRYSRRRTRARRHALGRDLGRLGQPPPGPDHDEHRDPKRRTAFATVSRI